MNEASTRKRLNSLMRTSDQPHSTDCQWGACNTYPRSVSVSFSDPALFWLWRPCGLSVQLAPSISILRIMRDGAWAWAVLLGVGVVEGGWGVAGRDGDGSIV